MRKRTTGTILAVACVLASLGGHAASPQPAAATIGPPGAKAQPRGLVAPAPAPDQQAVWATLAAGLRSGAEKGLQKVTDLVAGFVGGKGEAKVDPRAMPGQAVRMEASLSRTVRTSASLGLEQGYRQSVRYDGECGGWAPTSGSAKVGIGPDPTRQVKVTWSGCRRTGRWAWDVGAEKGTPGAKRGAVVLSLSNPMATSMLQSAQLRLAEDDRLSLEAAARLRSRGTKPVPLDLSVRVSDLEAKPSASVGLRTSLRF